MRRSAKPPKLLRNLPEGRALDAGAVREYANRQTRILKMVDTRLRTRLVVGRKLNPFEWHIAAVQKITDLVCRLLLEKKKDFFHWGFLVSLSLRHNSLRDCILAGNKRVRLV